MAKKTKTPGIATIATLIIWKELKQSRQDGIS